MGTGRLERCADVLEKFFKRTRFQTSERRSEKIAVSKKLTKKKVGFPDFLWFGERQIGDVMDTIELQPVNWKRTIIKEFEFENLKKFQNERLKKAVLIETVDLSIILRILDQSRSVRQERSSSKCSIQTFELKRRGNDLFTLSRSIAPCS